jgi:REP element-mobilizing transposase RayT
MSIKNKIEDGYLHFLTMTVVDWVDVFTRPVYKEMIVDSLRHCQQKKGLEIYAWVLMTNHLHLIASSAEGTSLSDILRDFKKFTSKRIVEAVKQEHESRKQWMLYRFSFNAAYNPKIQDAKFWQDGNEPKIIFSADFYEQKRNYIHNNPVRAGIVDEPEHYLYSSARNYADRPGLLDVFLA